MAAKRRVATHSAYRLLVMPHAIERALERHAEVLGHLHGDRLGRLLAEAVYAARNDVLVLPTSNIPDERQVGVPFRFDGQTLGYIAIDKDQRWSGPRAVCKTFLMPDHWQVLESFVTRYPAWYQEFKKATEGRHPYPEAQ